MTPLLRAIIADDLKELKRALQNSGWEASRDPYGLSPMEVARFLGREACLDLMGFPSPDRFKVQAQGESRPLFLDRKALKKKFSLTYRTTLTFSSYDDLKRVAKECPYLLRSRRLASDNYAWTERYRAFLHESLAPSAYVKWIDPNIGYGLFTDADLEEGCFVAEYAGKVRRLYRRKPDANAYCFHYPTRLWSWHYYAIDALEEGNLTRFINHSDAANLQPLWLVDRSLLHLIFIAKTKILQGSELTFDYGPDYWQKRKKM